MGIFTAQPEKSHWASRSGEQKKPRDKSGMLAVSDLLNRPGWKIIEKAMDEQIRRMKRRLYTEPLSRREWEAGKLVGWLEALEWAKTRPTEALHKLEVENGKA